MSKGIWEKAGAMPSIDTTLKLEEVIDEVRKAIQVSDPELAEARKRRSALAAALLDEFPGARIYINGSVAHGDALTPLADVDLGIVVPDPDNEYGPGEYGPKRLKVRAAEAIRQGVKEEYGELEVVVEGRKRSLLVRFRDPVAPGRPDFTADVIVAIDNPEAAGLFIPSYHTWDRAHPERHTELVRAANKDTKASFARVVRLLKHWNRSNSKPLCSWNIKALALDCITTRTALLPGVQTWFQHAIEQLSIEETPDPAGVAKNPIKLNDKMTRTEIVRRLTRSLETLERAIELEKTGYPILAYDQLTKFLNDREILPAPDSVAVMLEEAKRINAERAKHSKAHGAPALLTGTGMFAVRERDNVRSWGER